jgi:predicted small metal-binding protein
MAESIYRIECDPSCAFKVQSHDRQEAAMIAQNHLKNKHDKDVTEAELKAATKVV